MKRFIVSGLLVLISTITAASEVRFLNNNDLLKRPIQKTIPSVDPVFNVRWTLNKKGRTFPPDDPIATAFFSDIVQDYYMPNVLEIGTAYGELACSVLSTRQNVCYTGLDLDENHLHVATKKIMNKNPYATFTWKPCVGHFPHVESLPDKKYSHIGLFHVWHFLTPTESVKSMQQIERLLMPGGKVYIYTASPKSRDYGCFVPLWYNIRYYCGYEYPGYIAHAEEWVHRLKQWSLMSAQQTNSQSSNNSTNETFLFLDAQELADKIKKHTSLIVDCTATIENRKYSQIPRTYTGLIAHAPALDNCTLTGTQYSL